MLVREVLEEVITLPEAAELSEEMGYALDRANLVRYAQDGRLMARKSRGTWLTTRSALQALILEFSRKQRGRPRPQSPNWAEVELTPSLLSALDAIDERVTALNATVRSPEEQAQLHRELTVEAIYHTNRIEGNTLSLPEVRALVEAFWAEQEHTPNPPGQAEHDQSRT
jgi:hypothetical protein